MTQENKELLLKDLCARLPYGVLCEDMEGKTRSLFGITPTQHFIVTLDNATDGTNGLKFCTIDCVKPYLRPMSSISSLISAKEWTNLSGIDLIDWYNANHIDYRGLIEKGLALEAPEGMYK